MAPPPETAALRRLIQIALNVLPPSRGTDHAEAVRAGVKELIRRAGTRRQAALALAVHEELPLDLETRVIDALPRHKWTEANVRKALIQAMGPGPNVTRSAASVRSASERWRKRIELALKDPKRVIRFADLPLEVRDRNACYLCGRTDGASLRAPSYSASYDHGVYSAVDRAICADCAVEHTRPFLHVKIDSTGLRHVVSDVDPASGRA